MRFEVGIQALAPDLNVHRPGPRLRVDPREGDPVRRGPQPARSRPAKTLAVLDRPERLGPRGRDRLPRGHLERADRGRLRLHAEPGRSSASRTRSSIRFEQGHPGRDRRASRSRCCRRSSSSTQRAGRARRRPARHGRGPAGRHQEPRGVRGARRDRADHRAPGAGERHGRARPRPVQAHGRASAGPSWSTTGCGSRRSRTRSTRSSRRAQEHVTGEIRLTLHGGRAVPTGRRSDASLYDFSLATYDAGDTFDQCLAKGFVQLWGLPSKIAARRDQEPSERARERTMHSERQAVDRAQRGRTVSLWGGRFAAGPADALAALSKSTHFDWRLAPYDLRGLDGARPRAAPGRACSPTTSSPACSPRWTSSTPTSPSGAFDPAPDDEDVHTALERGLVERAGRGAGRQAARRPLAQRPGGHAVPDVAARRGPPGRRGRARRRRRARSPRPTPTRTRRCRAARTCSTPSRCCSPTTSPRTPTRCCATSTGCATGTGGPPCRRTGRVRWPGSSLGLDPEAVAGRARLRRQSPRTRSTARPRATSPPRPRSCCAMIAVDLSRIAEEVIIWATAEFGYVTLRRRLLHRQLDHAAEEEPRRRGAGAGQGGPADRQPDRPAGHAQGPAAGLQPRPPGGQGAAVRLGRAAGAAASRRRRHGRRR